MTAFDALAAGMADAVFATFGAAATLTPADGSGAVTVRADISRGTAEEILERGRLITPRSVARIPYVDAPKLRARDELEQAGKRWRLAGAPARVGQGVVWEAELEELN